AGVILDRDVGEQGGDRVAHLLRSLRVKAPAVSRQHPAKAEGEQLLERFHLLAPGIPTNASGHFQRVLLVVGPKMIAGEEKFIAIEKRHAAARMARHWDDQQIVVETQRPLAVDDALDVGGGSAHVLSVEDALA